MRVLLFLFCCFTIALLFGCIRKKEILLGNETVPKKLVIQSYISPQDSVTIVTVRFSEALTTFIPVNQGYNDLVPDADVVISGNGNQKFKLSFDNYLGYVSLPNELHIMPDSTYSLSVMTPDGNYTESSCRVPSDKVDSNSIAMNLLSNGAFDISWKDVGSGKDYYCIINNIIYIEANNPPRIQNSNRWYGITDNGLGGNIILRDLQISTKNTLSPGYLSELWICHTDFNFYEFTRTLLQQDRANQNPFGEPLPVYSNIKNGFGVFSALNRTVIYP